VDQQVVVGEGQIRANGEEMHGALIPKKGGQLKGTQTYLIERIPYHFRRRKVYFLH
jgi:hypothetical protein